MHHDYQKGNHLSERKHFLTRFSLSNGYFSQNLSFFFFSLGIESKAYPPLRSLPGLQDKAHNAVMWLCILCSSYLCSKTRRQCERSTAQNVLAAGP